MKIKVTVENDLAPSQISNALFNATPEEFAAFWLHFSTNARDQDQKLKEWAEAMSPEQGGAGKQLLRKLEKLITYYEIKPRTK